MKELEKALEVFAGLDVPQQREWLARFAEAHQQTILERRRELEAELKALEKVEVPAVSVSTRRGVKVEPKYRSKKNPELTWAGRGETPRWLREEMAASGKPLEHYRIKR